MPTRHLHYTVVEGIINCIREPSAFVVLKAFLLDLEEKVHPGCLQVTVVVTDYAVAVVLFDLLLVGLGGPNVKISIPDGSDMIGID